MLPSRNLTKSLIREAQPSNFNPVKMKGINMSIELGRTEIGFNRINSEPETEFAKFPDKETKMNSKEKLAQALQQEFENRLKTRGLFHLYQMIQKAKDGYYSDYDSPLDAPCVQLIKDLDFLGLVELSNRAKEGEFDATEEESNEWYKREGRAMALEVTRGNEEIADALFGKTKEETEAKEGIKGWDL